MLEFLKETGFHTHAYIFILLIYVCGACRGAVLAFYFYTEPAGLLVL